MARRQRAIPALLDAGSTYRRFARRGGERFTDEMGHVRNQPITRHWHEMDRAIKRHVAALMTDEGRRTSPAEFLRNLADDPVVRRCFPGTDPP